MDVLRRQDSIVDLDEDGAAIQSLEWVIQAAGQSQRCAYLTLTLITALGYEQVLNIAQEASQNLIHQKLNVIDSGYRVNLS